MNTIHMTDADFELVGMALQDFLNDNNAKLSSRTLWGIDEAEAAVRIEWMNNAQRLLEDVFGGTE